MIVVIGAGAAGLTCARELMDRGLDVLILEGRDRIGGRIQTARSESCEMPFELGAEFIHGMPPEILERAASFGLATYDLSDRHHSLIKGRLTDASGFWDEIASVTKRLRKNRSRDRSFAEFLENAKDVRGRKRADLISYVEGFQAADTHLISERNLAESEQGGSEEDERTSRMVGGYGPFAETLLPADRRRTVLRLGTIAKEIRWKKGEVEVVAASASGDRQVFRASKVVVTVPIGVLRADPGSKAAIRFDPEPPGFSKMLESLRMGGVVRLGFEFRSRFWERKHPASFGFLHDPKAAYFPTWWTKMPIRSPQWVAWQGGPKAFELSRKSRDEQTFLALGTFSRFFAMPVSRLEEQVARVFTHDWNRDPFSEGAYSYVVTDGADVCRRWQRPIQGTLFFAGEATSNGRSRGTVHGAIRSGLRAARQVLQSR